MSLTTLDIDDKACENVMRYYKLATKQEAVNFALKNVAPRESSARPLSLEEIRQFRGVGWDGDLDVMCPSRLREN